MAEMVHLECDACGAEVIRPAVVFARNGPRAFCNRTCAAVGRRKGKTDHQRKAEKAEYDREYRERNAARLKQIKAEYFQRTYDPEKARVERNRNMPRHVEYCRRPYYRVKKRVYDRKRRAQAFGNFAECFPLLQAIESEVAKRMTDYEIRLQQGTLNKNQTRKRQIQ